VRERGVGALAEQRLPRLLSPLASREVVARTRQLMEAQGAEGGIGATLAMRDRPDARALLPGVSVPLLGIAGEADVITPPRVVETLTWNVPSGRFVALPQAGHL
jgi:pimeloyl-ACP methyl ester carboxylesterase